KGVAARAATPRGGRNFSQCGLHAAAHAAATHAAVVTARVAVALRLVHAAVHARALLSADAVNGAQHLVGHLVMALRLLAGPLVGGLREPIQPLRDVAVDLLRLPVVGHVDLPGARHLVDQRDLDLLALSGTTRHAG